MDEEMKSRNRTISANNPEWQKIKDAAKKAGIPTARWARETLLAAAQKKAGK